MQTDEKKDLLRRYHTAWSKRDLEQLGRLLDTDCVTHNLGGEDKVSLKFETEACDIWHQSFTDVQVNIQQLLVDNDKVTVYWQLSSVHTDEFMGVEATQKEVTVAGMEINRIENGKITEIWRLSDTMGLMQQLNAV